MIKRNKIMPTNISPEEITNYIKNNYLTIEELATRSHVSVNKLKALIHNDCLPKHSHVISKQLKFHTEIFGETVFVEEAIFYYHPSLIKLAMKANQYLEMENFVDVANKMKADFIQELHQALIEIDEAKTVFSYCFDNDGNILAKGIEKLMAEHWPYIMNGTYGVCLKDISAKNMLLKNIAVALLEEWCNASLQNKAPLYDRTRYAAELYDRVASHFGPHEILKSTRARLFNKFKDNEFIT